MLLSVFQTYPFPWFYSPGGSQKPSSYRSNRENGMRNALWSLTSNCFNDIGWTCGTCEKWRIQQQTCPLTRIMCQHRLRCELHKLDVERWHTNSLWYATSQDSPWQQSSWDVSRLRILSVKTVARNLAFASCWRRPGSSNSILSSEVCEASRNFAT
jgi:hypothetical protein